MENRSRRRLRVLVWFAGLALLFALYASGLRRNPPGFYLDESAPAYNAYLVAHTGAGEFGPRFPLFFQYYTDSNTQIADPTQIYMLAAVFRFFPPSILLARLFSAFWVFAACLLLGLLAKRISGRGAVGVIVAATALVTPWFFEGRGLLLEPQFVPMALAPFLLALYHVDGKESWNWREAAMLAASLALVTYCYTSGRLLGPLLALGLVFFVTTRQRLVSVIKTGLLYGMTLVPILLFNRSHPGVLTKRLNEISYIRPGVPWSEIASQFVKRYLEDQSLMVMLMTGDYHPRHHVPGSGGALFFATFIFAIIGLVIVIARLRHDPWWRFVLYGLATSIVPGAISVEPFHGMRLMAYPVFLLLLTVPALEWLVARDKHTSALAPSPSYEPGEPLWKDRRTAGSVVAEAGPSSATRLWILCLLLSLTIVEAYRFQIFFRHNGPTRSFDFDVPYKTVYNAAIKQPVRPIYLEDGKWGPAYIHALWYATVERRPRSEFVHLAPGAKAPAGKVVISSAEGCQSCQSITSAGVYQLYKSL
jgi:4-amino-4-deoxy-L-arabinose transferase-like glycosyltransferase